MSLRRGGSRHDLLLGEGSRTAPGSPSVPQITSLPGFVVSYIGMLGGLGYLLSWYSRILFRTALLKELMFG